MELKDLCEVMGVKAPVMYRDHMAFVTALDVQDNTARIDHDGDVDWVKWHDLSSADPDVVEAAAAAAALKEAQIGKAREELKALHRTLPRVRYTDTSMVREDRIDMDHRLAAVFECGKVIVLTLDDDGELVGYDDSESIHSIILI